MFAHTNSTYKMLRIQCMLCAEQADSYGSTPLIAAINAGRSDIAAVLLGDASLPFDGADVEGIFSTD